MAKMQVNKTHLVRMNGKLYKENDVVEVDDATAKKHANVFRAADKGALETSALSDEVKAKREARKAQSQADAQAAAELEAKPSKKEK